MHGEFKKIMGNIVYEAIFQLSCKCEALGAFPDV